MLGASRIIDTHKRIAADKAFSLVGSERNG